MKQYLKDVKILFERSQKCGFDTLDNGLFIFGLFILVISLCRVVQKYFRETNGGDLIAHGMDIVPKLLDPCFLTFRSC